MLRRSSVRRVAVDKFRNEVTQAEATQTRGTFAVHRFFAIGMVGACVIGTVGMESWSMAFHRNHGGVGWFGSGFLTGKHG